MMSRIRILLVDDDEDDFVLTKDILSESPNSENYELSWCSNFSEAINAMLKGHYDIYLVDYRLGRDSGIALLNEAIKSNCTEPIIVLTGKGDFKIDEEAMRLGAADYLVKDTLNSQTLDRAIRYSLAHNSTLQKLKTSENKFRIIFERSKDPMLITNQSGLIIEANASAVNFFETSLPELLKLNAASLYKNEEDRLTYVRTINSEGSITDLEVELLTATGKAKFCSISSFLQVSQHGNEELFYSIIHDLTFRLNQEKEDLLFEKIDSTERIAKNLAKEIQNPLSNVNLAIDELHSTLRNEETLVLVDIIKNNCQKISDLTTELIESTETTSLALVDINFSHLLDTLLEEVTHEFHVNISSQPLRESITIKGDFEQLKSALKHVIKNAAEAIDSEDGRVLIEVEKRPTSLQILIIDNGSGISAADTDKIFEPFFTTKPKASGLGLTRAQRIIHAHKGKIQVNSPDGAETKISILLPLSHVSA